MYFNDSFIGRYINSYQEVLNAPTPIDGTAILFVNLDQGVMYSKKMINGQSYIQQFSIAPVNNFKEPEKDSNDILKSILDRLDKLEGGKNESK